MASSPRPLLTVLVYFTAGLTLGVLMTAFRDSLIPGLTTYSSTGHYYQTASGYIETPLNTSDINTTQLHNTRPAPPHTVHFQDQHLHQDNASTARTLYDKVRVLCWVMTYPNNHKHRTPHVKTTWGRRCNKILFFSESEDASIPTIKLSVAGGRDHLTAKTMQAFDYIHQHHVEEYDWFMKADDDTYVIVENLRYLLSEHKPSEPVYFGHHFKTIVKQGYFSGGAGYVISQEALRRFGRRRSGVCSSDHGAEDVEFGRCMERLGVKTGDTRDALGRSRFHCFDPETHLQGGYPDWYMQYDAYGGTLKGVHNLSDYSISFHYVSVEKMYALEFYVYHLRPFGIASGDQRLNV